jgi:hypothetical protein
LRSGLGRFSFCLQALSTLDGRFPGQGSRSRLRSTCATTQGQVHQALHDGTSSTAVGCLFAQPLDEFLLRFVDALGNQVLRETGCSFLSSFLTTCKRRTLDQLHTLSLGSVGNARQDAEGCEDFHRPGDDPERRRGAALLCSGTFLLSPPTCFTSTSANTQANRTQTTRKTKRTRSQERYC